MSERDHIISNPTDSQTGDFGKREPRNLQSAYANSPIYREDMTDETVKAAFVAAVQVGDATLGFEAHGTPVAGGTGNRMSSFDRDFVDAPNIAENSQTDDGKEFGKGEGAPTTPYIPPLTSPGPGSVSATDQPAYTGVVPNEDENIEFGSGLGGLANPSETSPEIAKQETVTALFSGRSYESSAG
jgi:hypothetical protein